MTTRLLCLSLCALGVMAAPAEGSCVRLTEHQRVSGADTVFVGRVVSVSRDGATARFRVLSVRKGSVERGSRPRVKAEPYPSSVTIGWNPRRGERWRIYADRRGDRWTTNDCKGSHRLS